MEIISSKLFVCIKFPVRHGEMGANSTGNYGQTVSCPVCEQCVSSQQETMSEKFPVRHVSSGIHLNRKLLANSFLSGMGLMRIIATGNY